MENYCYMTTIIVNIWYTKKHAPGFIWDLKLMAHPTSVTAFEISTKENFASLLVFVCAPYKIAPVMK